jgi:hypothetical protein
MKRACRPPACPLRTGVAPAVTARPGVRHALWWRGAGNGAKARLVLLPHEGHGYRARESVLHALYEQDQWLERFAGYGRVDPSYPLGGDATSTSSSSSVRVEAAGTRACVLLDCW